MGEIESKSHDAQDRITKMGFEHSHSTGIQYNVIYRAHLLQTVGIVL